MPATSLMSSNSPTETSRRSPRRDAALLVRAAFVCAVLATLLVAFYLVEKARGESAWKRYQDEARARGVKLTLLEYVPPPVPDERNFAAIPLFQDAFLKPHAGQPTSPPAGGRGEAAVVRHRCSRSADRSRGVAEIFRRDEDAAATGENAAADVLKALEHYAPQFEQLRVAGARPECRFPVRYEDGAAAALPHLQVLQVRRQLYALRLSAHLALGDSAAATRTFSGACASTRRWKRKPTLHRGAGAPAGARRSWRTPFGAGSRSARWGAPDWRRSPPISPVCG